MYPAMQCADIFFLKVDVCQLGMDQRKVNVSPGSIATQSNEKTSQSPLPPHADGVEGGPGENVKVRPRQRHLYGGQRG